RIRPRWTAHLDLKPRRGRAPHEALGERVGGLGAARRGKKERGQVPGHAASTRRPYPAPLGACMATLEFFFDIGSPYSYLAAGRVEAIAADCDASLRWRPFLLGGVFKLTGNQPPAMLPARGAYMLQDLLRWSRFYGVPFNLPSVFPAIKLSTIRALPALAPDAVHEATRAHVPDHTYYVSASS